MSKKYNIHIKKKVIADYNNGMLIKEIVSKYGLPRSTITDWVYKNKDIVDMHNHKYTKSKIDKYEEELRKKETIITIYEKLFSNHDVPLKCRLYVAEILYKEKFNVYLICNVLHVDKSKFYRYLKRKNTRVWFEKETELLTPLIIEIFTLSKGRFGPQKIKIKLEEKGFRVSQKKISSIMKTNKLVINRIRTKLVYPKKNKDYTIRNELKQNFNPDKPNVVWASDVTYIKVNDIDCYLCVIMDLFSRKAVGYMVSTTNTDSLTTRTFNKAYFERGEPQGLMFHSDRGSNYTSKKMKKLLKACGVKQSVSNTGNPYDNAVIESFFATFKKELINLKSYDTVAQLKIDVDEYMDYYNHYRPHRTLGNKTPSQFEDEYHERLNARKNWLN